MTSLDAISPFFKPKETKKITNVFIDQLHCMLHMKTCLQIGVVTDYVFSDVLHHLFYK